jgi:DNA-binding NarL/FixJ family response regulator
MAKKRKTNRFISDAYKDSIRPGHISNRDWAIWLEYNKGLYHTEIAMIHSMSVKTVREVIDGIIMKLKNNTVSVYNDDFTTAYEAFRFRDRIRNNVRLAEASGMSVVNIMSEV